MSRFYKSITQLFWQIGFPKKLHTDNGKEFKNENIKDFCQRHQIELVHGAPRTPQTQGLVERNNRTAKENLKNILKEKKVSLDTWCLFLGEAAYKKNITKHRAIPEPHMSLFLAFSHIKLTQQFHHQQKRKEKVKISQPFNVKRN